MAKVFFNPVLSINGTDLTDHVVRLVVDVNSEAKDTTASGDGWKKNSPGLKSGQVQIDFHQDFASANVNAVIAPLLGSYATVVARPEAGSASATNPSGTAVCFVETVQPHNGGVGDYLTQALSWPTHGTVTGFGL